MGAMWTGLGLKCREDDRGAWSRQLSVRMWVACTLRPSELANKESVC